MLARLMVANMAAVALLMPGACSQLPGMGQATAFPTTSGPIAAAEIDGPAAGAAVETTSAQRDQRCTAPAEPLPSLTEGPYFKAGSPERTSLIEPGTAGEPLTLRGFVFDVECTPLSGAKLDFWQADSNGAYDNAGFQMRGHQFTDAAGAYVLTTVVPGLYPGRTEHIHVKVQPQGGTVLTTQLFFPDVTGNQTDRIFDSRLVIRMQHANNGWAGTFDFIVPGSG